MWRLNQTKQCKTCPWRKDSKTKNIPDYCFKLHKNLQDTVADKPSIKQLFDSSLRKVVLCHYSSPDSEKFYCIGWVYNQLGTGNNIRLRLPFMTCQNASEI